MPSHLKTYSTIPTGEYYIKVLLRDGKEEIYFGRCKGTPGCRIFGPSPEIDRVARNLGQFRSANGLPRADYRSCLEDVDNYTCVRLGGNSQWCIESDKTYDQLNPPTAPGGCSNCGQKLDA